MVAATLRRLGTLENAAVALLAGDGETAKVRRAGHRGSGEDAEALEEVAANIHALMAGDAAVILEERVTPLLLGRQCTGLTTQPAVKTGVPSKQRALKARQRIEHLGRLEVVPVGVGESFAVSRIGAQLA